MRRSPHVRSIALAAAGALIATAVAGSLAMSGAALAAPGSFVRVDQVGYLPSDPKHAYLMATGPVGHAGFDVVDVHGKVVARGAVSTSNRGPWNASYPYVYDLTFSRLTRFGDYRVRVHGGVSAQSPSFEIASAAALYGKVVADGVNFYQVQRDGANVIEGSLNRQPSHQNDTRATVYE
ncbi:MAG: endoglucanase, partial [Actinomycetota bacterium]|nr:endoglucanase [Actinomycetota bacterium]